MAILTLNKNEEETLKKSLLDFIQRVSSPSARRNSDEIQILPKIIELSLSVFVNKNLTACNSDEPTSQSDC